MGNELCRGKIALDISTVEKLLNVPSGVRITSANWNDDRQELIVFLSGSYFKEVPYGCPPLTTRPCTLVKRTVFEEVSLDWGSDHG